MGRAETTEIPAMTRPEEGTEGPVTVDRPVRRLPDSLLSNHPPDTALIRYRDKEGKIVDWFVGADPLQDDEGTLTGHLARWVPDSEFIGWAIK
jgi:hypothetical protein